MFATTSRTTSCTTDRKLFYGSKYQSVQLTLSGLPSYYRELKKYHLQHHYADYQKGFGVTSKIWDKVFGTELLYGGPQPLKNA